MSITALPTPPSRDDPSNFAQRADDFLAALPAFAAQAEAARVEVNANTATCQSAAQVSNVTSWVSGQTYALGAAVYDPTDFLTYRRKAAGSGTTRPGLDATKWALLTGFGNMTLETNQTVSGVKTFAETIDGNAATSTIATNCSRSVSGAGLASGGGALTADLAITVTKATQAQAEAGTDDATAMTPLRTAQAIAARTAAAATGAVGTYALLGSTDTTSINPGSTKAGSSLRYVGLAISSGTWVGTALADVYGLGVNIAPSGTWRCMGFDVSYYSGVSWYGATLWLRIA